MMNIQFQNGHFKKCNDWLASRYGEDQIIDWSLVPSKKPAVPCISDKENLNNSANQAPVESQSVKVEVKAKPPVDEFDEDDDAVQALLEAEACSSPV
jgi:uracil-DNA glycosylase